MAMDDIRVIPGNSLRSGLPADQQPAPIQLAPATPPQPPAASDQPPTPPSGSSKLPLDADALDAMIEEKAQRYGVDPNLARAIVQVESNGNPHAVNSKSGAMGLMQLMPDTARMLGVKDPYDPAQNLDGGIRYLKQIEQQTGQSNPGLLAAGFQSGPNRASLKAGQVPNLPDTQAYVQKVMGIYQGLAQPAPGGAQAASPAQPAQQPASQQPGQTVWLGPDQAATGAAQPVAQQPAAPLPWPSIANDPRYQKAPDAVQAKIRQGYFETYILPQINDPAQIGPMREAFEDRVNPGIGTRMLNSIKGAMKQGAQAVVQSQSQIDGQDTQVPFPNQPIDRMLPEQDPGQMSTPALRAALNQLDLGQIENWTPNQRAIYHEYWSRMNAPTGAAASAQALADTTEAQANDNPWDVISGAAKVLFTNPENDAARFPRSYSVTQDQPVSPAAPSPAPMSLKPEVWQGIQNQIINHPELLPQIDQLRRLPADQLTAIQHAYIMAADQYQANPQQAQGYGVAPTIPNKAADLMQRSGMNPDVAYGEARNQAEIYPNQPGLTPEQQKLQAEKAASFNLPGDALSPQSAKQAAIDSGNIQAQPIVGAMAAAGHNLAGAMADASTALANGFLFGSAQSGEMENGEPVQNPTPIPRFKVADQEYREAQAVLPYYAQRPWAQMQTVGDKVNWLAAQVALNAPVAVGMLASTLAPQIAPAFLTAMGLQAGGQAYGTDINKGASVENALADAWSQGIVTGLTGAMPLHAFQKISGYLTHLTPVQRANFLGTVLRRVGVTAASATTQGTVGAAQMGFNQVMNNLSARYLGGDPNVHWDDNLTSSMISGAAMMAPLGLRHAWTVAGTAMTPEAKQQMIDRINATFTAENTRQAALQAWEMMRLGISKRLLKQLQARQTEQNPSGVPGALPANEVLGGQEKDDQGSGAGNPQSPDAGTQEPLNPVLQLNPNGAGQQASTPNGTTVDTRYALVEAPDLITSHDTTFTPNPAYPAGLQPRNRARAAMQQQVLDISRTLDPNKLVGSLDAKTGAPIVGPDGAVESGNGRSIALQLAYQNGGADAYRQHLIDNAGSFGFDPQQVASMRQPVLVRVRTTPLDDAARQAFARDANREDTARMGEAEQAATDAQQIPHLNGLAVNDDGSINWQASRPFTDWFRAKVAQDDNFMTQDGGELSNAGKRRITNAVLAKAYGSNAAHLPIVTGLIESDHDGFRNMGKALLRAAPLFAVQQDAAARGMRHDTGFVPALLDAIGRYREFKANPAFKSLDEYLNQQDAFSAPIAPETATLMRALDQHQKSATGLYQFLKRAHDAIETAGSPQDGDLLGNQSAPSLHAILQAAQGESHGAQTQIPTGPAGTGNGTATDGRGATAAGERSGMGSNDTPTTGGNGGPTVPDGQGVQRTGPGTESAGAGPAAQNPVRPYAKDELPPRLARFTERSGGDLGVLRQVIWHNDRYAVVREMQPKKGTWQYQLVDHSGPTARIINPHGLTGDEVHLLDTIKAADKARETALQQQHPDGPFGVLPIQGGVAAHPNVPPEYAQLLRAWKKLLGIKGRIFLFDSQSAASPDFGDQFHLYGEYGRAQNAKLAAHVHGQTQPFGPHSEDYWMALSSHDLAHQAPEYVLEIMAHELGHVFQHAVVTEAPHATQEKLMRAHQQWLEANRNKTKRGFVKALRAPISGGQMVAKMSKADRTKFTDPESQAYWFSFNEWFADNVSKYMNSQKVPQSFIGKFFKGVADKLRALYGQVANAMHLPDAAVKDFIDQQIAQNQAQPTDFSGGISGDVEDAREPIPNHGNLDLRGGEAGGQKELPLGIPDLKPQTPRADGDITTHPVDAPDAWLSQDPILRATLPKNTPKEVKEAFNQYQALEQWLADEARKRESHAPVHDLADGLARIRNIIQQEGSIKAAFMRPDTRQMVEVLRMEYLVHHMDVATRQQKLGEVLDALPHFHDRYAKDSLKHLQEVIQERTRNKHTPLHETMNPGWLQHLHEQYALPHQARQAAAKQALARAGDITGHALDAPDAWLNREDLPQTWERGMATKNARWNKPPSDLEWKFYGDPAKHKPTERQRALFQEFTDKIKSARDFDHAMERLDGSTINSSLLGYGHDQGVPMQATDRYGDIVHNIVQQVRGDSPYAAKGNLARAGDLTAHNDRISAPDAWLHQDVAPTFKEQLEDFDRIGRNLVHYRTADDTQRAYGMNREGVGQYLHTYQMLNNVSMDYMEKKPGMPLDEYLQTKYPQLSARIKGYWQLTEGRQRQQAQAAHDRMQAAGDITGHAVSAPDAWLNQDLAETPDEKIYAMSRFLREMETRSSADIRKMGYTEAELNRIDSLLTTGRHVFTEALRHTGDTIPDFLRQHYPHAYEALQSGYDELVAPKLRPASQGPTGDITGHDVQAPDAWLSKEVDPDTADNFQAIERHYRRWLASDPNAAATDREYRLFNFMNDYITPEQWPDFARSLGVQVPDHYGVYHSPDRSALVDAMRHALDNGAQVNAKNRFQRANDITGHDIQAPDAWLNQSPDEGRYNTRTALKKLRDQVWDRSTGAIGIKHFFEDHFSGEHALAAAREFLRDLGVDYRDDMPTGVLALRAAKAIREEGADIDTTPEVQARENRVAQAGDITNHNLDAPDAWLNRDLSDNGLSKKRRLTLPVAAAFKAADLLNGGFEGILKAVTKPVSDAINQRILTPFGKFLQDKLPEKLQAAFINDYGLDDKYLDRRLMLNVKEQKMQRTIREFMDKLNVLSRLESRIAYEWMTTHSSLPHAQKMLDQLPPQARQTLTEIKDLIVRMGAEAVKLKLLSADAYQRNQFAYLHRMYRDFELQEPAMRGRRRAAQKIIGDTFKGRGMFDPVDMSVLSQSLGDWWTRKLQGQAADKALMGETFWRLEKRQVHATPNLPGITGAKKGKLTDTVYWPVREPIPAHLSSYTRDDAPWTVRAVKGGKAVMWRDFTPEERQALGEIDEVKYAVAMTLTKMAHDLDTARYFDWIARTYGKSEEQMAAENLKPAEVAASEQAWHVYRKADWVQVPESNIPKTTIKRYGNLAGRYVPGPIWNDLRSIEGMRGVNAPLGETYARVLRAWKVNKTARSLVVHTNNIISNFIFADLNDVRWESILRALETMSRLKTDPKAQQLWEDYQTSGANYGGFYATEMKNANLDPLIAELRKELAGMQPAQANLSLLSVLSALKHGATLGEKLGEAHELMQQNPLYRGVVKADRKMRDLYASEDDVFRLAIYLQSVEDGLTSMEAGKKARQAFVDYHLNAPAVQLLRGTAMPFITFAYGAGKMMAKAIANKPWKLMKYWLFFNGLNYLTTAIATGGNPLTEDRRQRALLPDEVSGSIYGVFPKLQRLPFGDSSAPTFLDVRRYFPMGDVFDLDPHAAIPMLPEFMPGGPLATVFEIALNKQGFIGQPITDRRLVDDPYMRDMSLYAWRAFMPNAPWVPLSYGQKSLWDAAHGRSNTIGAKQNLIEAMLNNIGVKVASYPKDNMRAQAAVNVKTEYDAEQNVLRAEGRDLEKYRNNPAQYQKMKEQLMQDAKDSGARMKKEAERLRDKLKAAQ